MPELPEVETVCNGLRPYLEGNTICKITVRQPQLRWLVPSNLHRLLRNCRIKKLSRRAKYIVMTTDNGHVIMHLGMSGQLRIVPKGTDLKKHDHVDIALDDDSILRYNDPRRFGCILWTDAEPYSHKLLSKLGVEPLERQFTGKYLYDKARNKTVAIKQFIMNANIVVGVGNIYASESLFIARIHPLRQAQNVTIAECNRLVSTIKTTLKNSIAKGGTTLKDFVDSKGNPGYFAQTLKVYGRENQPCLSCNDTIINKRIGQRSTFFCNTCQL